MKIRDYCWSRSINYVLQVDIHKRPKRLLKMFLQVLLNLAFYLLHHHIPHLKFMWITCFSRPILVETFISCTPRRFRAGYLEVNLEVHLKLHRRTLEVNRQALVLDNLAWVGKVFVLHIFFSQIDPFRTSPWRKKLTICSQLILKSEEFQFMLVFTERMSNTNILFSSKRDLRDFYRVTPLLFFKFTIRNLKNMKFASIFVKLLTLSQLIFKERNSSSCWCLQKES